MKKLDKALLLFVILAIASINQSFAVDLKGSLFSHDPATLIKDGDNYWHFFTAPGVGAAYSKDMVNWTSSNNHIFQPGHNWKSDYPAWTIPYFGSGKTANTDGNLYSSLLQQGFKKLYTNTKHLVKLKYIFTNQDLVLSFMTGSCKLSTNLFSTSHVCPKG